MPSRVDISVVATLYRSAEFLEEFQRRVKAEVERLTPSYEILLVNDGSPDQSLELAVALHRSDPRVRVVDLSRNFARTIARIFRVQPQRWDGFFHSTLW